MVQKGDFESHKFGGNGIHSSKRLLLVTDYDLKRHVSEPHKIRPFGRKIKIEIEKEKSILNAIERTYDCD